MAEQPNKWARYTGPNGKLAATGAEDIALWDATTHALIARWDHTSYVWGLAFSPDSRSLVSTHGDGSILLWDMLGRERVANLNQHSHPVAAIAISPDGRRVASGGEDRSIILWDAAAGHKEAVLLGLRSRVTGLAFAPDGQWLASLDQSGELTRWDSAQHQPSWRSEAKDTGKKLAVSLDGRWIATVNALHQSDTGAVAFTYVSEQKQCGYNEVAFSLDGRRLAAVGNWQVRLWDTDRRQLIGQTRTPQDELSLRHVVSVGDDKTIKLWDVPTRKLAQELGTHTAPVLAVAFSRDGKQIVTGEHDKSVRVYTRQRSLWAWRLD